MGNPARNEKFGKSSKPSKPPATQPTEYDAPFIGYINWKPTEADKELFHAWIEAADLSAVLDEAGDDGYKLGVAYNEKTKVYTATLTCRSIKLPNAGYCLSVVAPTMSKAFQRLLFCHVAVAGPGWERLGMLEDDAW